MQFTHIVSSIILAVIFVGLWQRKNTKVHVPLMISAFVLDVLLVLYIELNLQAVETVVDNTVSPDGDSFLIFHAVVSLIVILLYGVATYTGFKLIKKQRQFHPLHKKIGVAFIIFRLINYVTSFML